MEYVSLVPEKNLDQVCKVIYVYIYLMTYIADISSIYVIRGSIKPCIFGNQVICHMWQEHGLREKKCFTVDLF